MHHGEDLNPTSGGYLHAVNRPNKTEVPPDWDESMIAREITDVVCNPDSVIEQFGRTCRVTRVRHGVSIRGYVWSDVN
jgi:hypothetical protein